MKKTFYTILAIAFLLLPAAVAWSADPIYVAVSAPLTGNYAEYGQNWQKAMNLAVGWLNAAGGINGRPLELVYNDSKSDPKDAAALAQKYTSDPKYVAQIGDFTSTACMAAQPIYDKAGMVHGIIGTQAGEGPFMARYAVEKLGKKKIAVLYINNDWGIATKDYFVKPAKDMGADILAIESFFETDKDFTGVLTKLRGYKPELLYIPSMYNEMALIAKQREKLGWTDVLLSGPGSLYSPKLLEIGGTSVNGLYTSAVFFPKDPSPAVQKFVKGYEEKYKSTPNMFAAIAYDGANLMAETIRKAGTNRKAIRDELAKTKDFVGVTGKIAFTEQRDVVKDYRHLVIKNVEFVLYEGK
ncbi:MAG: hypothetical protein H6Q42_4703 [Deltaproteobacteria bacterium]|nr:hypothetical protein [Deltaproteobacteria bacterium]